MDVLSEGYPDAGTRRPRLTRREYMIVGGGLTAIAAIGWAYMFYMAWAMNHMGLVQMWMPPVGGAASWTGLDFFMLFSMWAVMMIAMMVPSVTPMVMMFTAVNRNKRAREQPYASTFVFLAGYLIAWTGFSLLAALAQWPLHTAGLMDPMMDSSSYLLSGSVLILAGLYQWTSYKDACLHQCRTPLGFLMTQWRDGTRGALIMGIRHGLFCIGCCWALMMVLFAVGVMNMLWVLLIAVFVLLEKIMPAGSIGRAVSGIGLIVWGGYWLTVYPW